MRTTGDQGPDGATPPLRRRLLDATLALLTELEPVDLVAAVGTREIARRAGSSPASVNYHFGSIQGLADAVVKHVFDGGAAPVGRITSLLAQVEDAHFPLEAAYAMHGAEFDRLTTDPEFRLRMGLWALGGRTTTLAFRKYLRAIDDQVGAMAQQLFASWGREVRPPLDIASYIAVKVGLVNGNTLRQLVEPAATRRADFQRASVALDMVLLRVDGDTHTTDDRLAEMNYYPLKARAASGREGRADATRSRILHAAAELFTTHGYADTRLGRIAAQADVGSSTLSRYYGSKEAVAADLFRQQAAELIRQPAGDLEAAVALHAYLTDLASFVPPRSSYAGPYLAALLATTAPPRDELVDTAHRLLLDVLLDASSQADADVAETATLLVGLTIRRALLHPAGPPGDAATHVLALCTGVTP